MVCWYPGTGESSSFNTICTQPLPWTKRRMWCTMGVSQNMLGHWYDGLETKTLFFFKCQLPMTQLPPFTSYILLTKQFCYFVSPKTISLQEYTKTEVILAIKLHCDNPVEKEKTSVETWHYFNGHLLQKQFTMGWHRGWGRCWTELKNC